MQGAQRIQGGCPHGISEALLVDGLPGLPQSQGMLFWVSPTCRHWGLKPRARGCAGSREGPGGALHEIQQRCRRAELQGCACSTKFQFGCLCWKLSGPRCVDGQRPLREHVQ